jgi:cytochrome c oxidase assembly factor CtaG
MPTIGSFPARAWSYARDARGPGCGRRRSTLGEVDLSPLGEWTFSPAQLAPLALGVGMYAARARTLARRGTPVPRGRLVAFGAFVALALLALASPVHALGEDRLFSAHMLQHVALGDLAALALVLSLSGPILRPVLAVRVFERLRVLAHPFVALPLWTANLLVGHLPSLYEGALGSEVAHAFEHVSFFTAGALMWAPVVEVLPGAAWFGTGAKLGYVVAVRLIETAVGNVFFWAGEPFYSTYARAEGVWGLSAAADQATAGAIMMVEGSLVTVAVGAWLFLRWGAESELRQELIERGLDPVQVRRAVRYGRGRGLQGG